MLFGAPRTPCLKALRANGQSQLSLWYQPCHRSVGWTAPRSQDPSGSYPLPEPFFQGGLDVTLKYTRLLHQLANVQDRWCLAATDGSV